MLKLQFLYPFIFSQPFYFLLHYILLQRIHAAKVYMISFIYLKINVLSALWQHKKKLKETVILTHSEGGYFLSGFWRNHRHLSENPSYIRIVSTKLSLWGLICISDASENPLSCMAKSPNPGFSFISLKSRVYHGKLGITLSGRKQRQKSCMSEKLHCFLFDTTFTWFSFWWIHLHIKK